MANYLRDISLLILSEQCYDNYLMDFNFLDIPCFKSTLSKILGLTIIAGSIMVKLPQILKIINNKSGQGISLTAVCLELFAITASMSYSMLKGFPFSAWGEGTFIGLQTSVIAALVLYYGNKQSQALIFFIGYFLITALLTSGLVPIEVLWCGQTVTVPIIFTGKMIQARANYTNKSTGQLSGVTCSMLLGGAIARIFTSIQETGDPIMILTFSVSAFANFVLVSQLVWYRNSDQLEKKKA